ncbi:hypothetical protein PR048_001498 [Dryococelus australis]|uniref:Retropepsins domain-containing protein n=1 Tax=Dryococelus australis TaxID=614101 RepID=A0ABQ9IJ07_9NEOP|nr:hypothetical protein PR048_001498 [Dryococelus australis]
MRVWRSRKTPLRVNKIVVDAIVDMHLGIVQRMGRRVFNVGKKIISVVFCEGSIKTSRNDKEDELFVDSIAKVSEIKSNVTRSWMKILKIGNEMVKFKVDTGSEVNIISKYVVNKIFKNEKISMTKTNVILEAYGCTHIKPLGKIELQCETSNKFVVLEFFIVNMNVQPIIGLATCYALVWLNVQTHSVGVNEEKEKIILANGDVFEGVGLFKEHCKIVLKKDSIPVAKPARRLPLVIKKRLANKLGSKGIRRLEYYK